jgi:hypothetical protein
MMGNNDLVAQALQQLYGFDANVSVVVVGEFIGEKVNGLMFEVCGLKRLLCEI